MAPEPTQRTCTRLPPTTAKVSTSPVGREIGAGVASVDGGGGVVGGAAEVVGATVVVAAIVVGGAAVAVGGATVAAATVTIAPSRVAEVAVLQAAAVTTSAATDIAAPSVDPTLRCRGGGTSWTASSATWVPWDGSRRRVLRACWWGARCMCVPWSVAGGR